MTRKLGRREALATAGALGTVAASTATAGCLAAFRTAPVEPSGTPRQFRGGLERRGVYPDATIPQEATQAWELRGLNTGDHTAAKASAVPTEDGDLVVPGDSGVLWRVTPDGERVWEATLTDASRGFHGTPALLGDVGFVGAYDGVLYAFDVETGDVHWRANLGDAIGSSPAVVDETVYVAVEYYEPSGAVFGVDARSGDVVWEDQRVTDHPHSTLAIDEAAGRLVVGANDGKLYAWSYPDLEFQWTFQTGNDIKGPVATYDGAAFVGSWDFNVYRVALDDGTEDWSVATDGLVMSGPAVDTATDRVYIGSKDDRLYALDAGSGALRWWYDAGDSIIGCPTVAGEHVLVGSYDATLHAVEAETGDGVWRVETVGRVTSTPRVHDGAVYYADRAAPSYIEDGSGKSGGFYKIASGV